MVVWIYVLRKDSIQEIIRLKPTFNSYRLYGRPMPKNFDKYICNVRRVFCCCTSWFLELYPIYILHGQVVPGTTPLDNTYVQNP